MTAGDLESYRRLRQEAFDMVDSPSWFAFDEIFATLIDNPPKLKETTND